MNETLFWLLRLAAGELCSYDEYDSFVIEASNEDMARLTARDSGGDSRERWLDKARTTCEPLLLRGETGVVVGSFNAG